MEWVRAGLIWIVIIVVESIHGVLRGLYLQPAVGDLDARQIGVLVGSLLILLIAYLFRQWLREMSARAQLGVGLLWIMLTVAFEVGLGRFILKLSWERIFSDYNISRGGFMVFGLVILGLAPLLAVRLGAVTSQRVENRAP
ncbi:MAG: hypothetical protein ABI624_08895 [Casimicrobiaceae bacterium]